MKKLLGDTHCDTTPAQPAGRTLAEFQPLQPSEQQLLLACRTGELANVSNGLPKVQTPDNHVRAGFLRFLALGGDAEAPLHEHGIQLRGAWINGVLDMEGANIPRNLMLWGCYFESAPILRDAQMRGTINFSGAHLPGLQGDSLNCTGSVFLRHGHFDGEVRLLGASIGGNLECSNASFDGKGKHALGADGLRVQGAFFLRSLKTPLHRASFSSAHVGRLIDDRDCWGDEPAAGGRDFRPHPTRPRITCPAVLAIGSKSALAGRQ